MPPRRKGTATGEPNSHPCLCLIPLAFAMLFPMLLPLLEYAGRISWRLNTDDPPLFPLAQASPWFLLNPLLYCRLPQPINNQFEQFAARKYYGSTSGIVVATDNEDAVKAYKSIG